MARKRPRAPGCQARSARRREGSLLPGSAGILPAGFGVLAETNFCGGVSAGVELLPVATRVPDKSSAPAEHTPRKFADARTRRPAGRMPALPGTVRPRSPAALCALPARCEPFASIRHATPPASPRSHRRRKRLCPGCQTHRRDARWGIESRAGFQNRAAEIGDAVRGLVGFDGGG